MNHRFSLENIKRDLALDEAKRSDAEAYRRSKEKSPGSPLARMGGEAGNEDNFDKRFNTAAMRSKSGNKTKVRPREKSGGVTPVANTVPANVIDAINGVRRAIKSGNVDSIKQLIQDLPDEWRSFVIKFDQVESDKGTDMFEYALLHAPSGNVLDMLRKLLPANLAAKLFDKNRRIDTDDGTISAITLATLRDESEYGGVFEIVEWLMDNGFKPDADAIAYAIGNNDIGTAELIASKVSQEDIAKHANEIQRQAFAARSWRAVSAALEIAPYDIDEGEFAKLIGAKDGGSYAADVDTLIDIVPHVTFNPKSPGNASESALMAAALRGDVDLIKAMTSGSKLKKFWSYAALQRAHDKAVTANNIDAAEAFVVAARDGHRILIDDTPRGGVDAGELLKALRKLLLRMDAENASHDAIDERIAEIVKDNVKDNFQGLDTEKASVLGLAIKRKLFDTLKILLAATDWPFASLAHAATIADYVKWAVGAKLIDDVIEEFDFTMPREEDAVRDMIAMLIQSPDDVIRFAKRHKAPFDKSDNKLSMPAKAIINLAVKRSSINIFKALERVADNGKWASTMYQHLKNSARDAAWDQGVRYGKSKTIDTNVKTVGTKSPVSNVDNFAAMSSDDDWRDQFQLAMPIDATQTIALFNNVLKIGNSPSITPGDIKTVNAAADEIVSVINDYANVLQKEREIARNAAKGMIHPRRDYRTDYALRTIQSKEKIIKKIISEAGAAKWREISTVLAKRVAREHALAATDKNQKRRQATEANLDLVSQLGAAVRKHARAIDVATNKLPK